MAPQEKYHYFKYYIYRHGGRPEIGITHDENLSLSYAKDRIERAARQRLGANFHYLDIWTMHPWFMEIIEYKRENGLE